jgi:hypothetical protein
MHAFGVFCPTVVLHPGFSTAFTPSAVVAFTPQVSDGCALSLASTVLPSSHISIPPTMPSPQTFCAHSSFPQVPLMQSLFVAQKPALKRVAAPLLRVPGVPFSVKSESHLPLVFVSTQPFSPPMQRRSLLQKCPGPLAKLPSSHSSSNAESEIPSPQAGSVHEHRQVVGPPGLLVLPVVTAFEQIPVTPPTMQSMLVQHGLEGGFVAFGPLMHSDSPASHSSVPMFVAPSPQMLAWH